MKVFSTNETQQNETKTDYKVDQKYPLKVLLIEKFNEEYQRVFNNTDWLESLGLEMQKIDNFFIINENPTKIASVLNRIHKNASLVIHNYIIKLLSKKLSETILFKEATFIDSTNPEALWQNTLLRIWSIILSFIAYYILSVYKQILGFHSKNATWNFSIWYKMLYFERSIFSSKLNIWQKFLYLKIFPLNPEACENDVLDYLNYRSKESLSHEKVKTDSYTKTHESTVFLARFANLYLEKGTYHNSLPFQEIYKRYSMFTKYAGVEAVPQRSFSASISMATFFLWGDPLLQTRTEKGVVFQNVKFKKQKKSFDSLYIED